MSPYFNQIIMRARRDSYKAVSSPKQTNKKPALPAPIVSTLIKASISKEKNKNAVEMVYRIVALIEQAGSSKDALPHINALELVNRCEHLRLDLEKASLNYKNTILRRTFTRAWQLLWKPFFRYAMGIGDPDGIFRIVLTLLPFYVAYEVSSVCAGIFTAAGKTAYNFVISIIVNVGYYGLMYALYSNGAFRAGMMFICLLFGGGMAVNAVCGLILLRRLRGNAR